MIDRRRIEQLLANYIDVLRSATATCEYPDTQREYAERLQVAVNIVAQWRGGLTENALTGAVKLELGHYRSIQLSGYESEYIGRAFGELCRAIRVTT